MKTTACFIIFLVLFASACSSGVKISSHYEEDVDFSEYTTFNMLPIEYEATERLEYSEENKQIITDAIISELEALNYKQETNTPDVMVYAMVTIQREEQKRERTFQDGPYYTGQRNFSWSASDSILVGYYDKGSLVINMIDAKKNELVWHATARKALKNNPVNTGEKIRQAIADMFDEYPGNPMPPTSMK